MAPSAAIGPVPDTSQRDDAPSSIINCSVTGCLAKIDGKRQVLCEAHLQVFSKTDRPQHPVQPNGTHAPPDPPSASGLGRSGSIPNPRKLLPETDKDRPFMRRKTAGNPPPFVPQQPTPKHSTPPSRGEPTKSPPSQPLAPRPLVHSPPASPGPLPDDEPARKRPRRSSSPGQSLKPNVNGVATSRLSTTELDKPMASASPKASRHGVNQSPQRPGKPREKESKPSSKPNLKHPVRRIPLQMSKLRFLDSPEDALAGIFSAQSSSGVNGCAENVPRRESGASDSSLNVAIKDYLMSKTSNPTRTSSELPNGQNKKVLPERRKSDTRPGYGPFQANGIVPPKLRPNLPIKPAQITKTQPVKLPPPKQIDTARFDALIYAQEGASSPPPDAEIATQSAIDPPAPLPPQPPASDGSPKPKDEPLYLPIDPRIHWPQPHSATWHATKQAEIQARGRKKANFGRAAQSLRRQREQQPPTELDLPEKMWDNPAWVRAVVRLKGMATSSAALSDGEGGNNGIESEDGEPEVRRGARKQGGGGVKGKKVAGKKGMVVVTGLRGRNLSWRERERSEDE